MEEANHLWVGLYLSMIIQCSQQHNSINGTLAMSQSLRYPIWTPLFKAIYICGQHLEAMRVADLND